MAIRRSLSYSAELGGGNIHEFSSGFLGWKTYWYTNNLTEDLGRKFHKTQKRNDIRKLDLQEFSDIANLIFGETDKRPHFLGMAVNDIMQKLNLDYKYFKRMCEKNLLQRGYYQPKEPQKFLNCVTRGTDEIEIMFPTRKLVTIYFVKKERSGEAREIRSKDYEGELETEL